MIKNGKNCNEKNHITDRHIKRHDSIEKKLKSIIKHSHELSAIQQSINNPTQKHVAVFFKDVKTEETFSSQDQKLVVTTNL